jgi:hypothetical protein
MVRTTDLRKEIRDNLNAIRTDLAAVHTVVGQLVNDVVAIQGGDALLSAPGLAIGTSSAAKVKHNAFNVRVDGNTQLIAAAEVAFTATTHDIADPDAAGREAIYVLSVNAAGTVTITKGSDAALGAAVAPATPAGEVKMGEVKVAHDGSAIFDASTDLLSAAHLTDTYTDATLAALTSSAPAAISSVAFEG